MKNTFIFALLLFVTFTGNAKYVRFSVDMTGQVVNTTGIHISGDFQEAAGYPGGNWQSNTTEMTNDPGTEIYSVLVNIPAFAKYEYKFINGDQWYEVEFVPIESRVGYNYNDNRWIYIDSLYNDTTQLHPVLFSGNAPAGMYLLRLKVDLQLEPSVSDQGVHVAGDFQGWDPAITSLYSFEEKVYEYMAYVGQAAGYAEYRFVNGNSSAGFETVPAECATGENRSIVILKDTIADLVCFASCIACSPQGYYENEIKTDPLLYPNPMNAKSILEFNDDLTYHDVTITDLTGKTVRIYKEWRDHTLEISRNHLNEGIYFVRISNEERWLSTLRMIISH